MRALDGLTDVGFRFVRRFPPLVGLAARAQAAGTELNGLVRCAAAQCLRIGIGADELHASHRRRDHVLHCVAATAPHADHLDLCPLVKALFFNHFDGHVFLLKILKK